jgi:hypothetical protein
MAHRHSAKNQGLSADPGTWLHYNRRIVEFETSRAAIVRASTQEHALTQTRIVTYRNWFKVQ